MWVLSDQGVQGTLKSHHQYYCYTTYLFDGCREMIYFHLIIKDLSYYLFPWSPKELTESTKQTGKKWKREQRQKRWWKCVYWLIDLFINWLSWNFTWNIFKVQCTCKNIDSVLYLHNFNFNILTCLIDIFLRRNTSPHMSVQCWQRYSVSINLFSILSNCSFDKQNTNFELKDIFLFSICKLFLVYPSLCSVNCLCSISSSKIYWYLFLFMTLTYSFCVLKGSLGTSHKRCHS